MRKAIHIEDTGRIVERILSIAEPEIIENNPTNLMYFIVDEFPEEPAIENQMCVNYPMYNKNTQEVIWIQVDYKYTATNERLEIENLKTENIILNENINTLTEALADMIGGAI